MNNVDRTYLRLLKDVMDNGVEKDTRSGKVKSVFGRQLRFDLKDGLPLLTTKKIFTKGVIHELLWFLQRPYNSHGSMNIEYLVRNGVHIWDDDAYRWFKTEIAEGFSKRPLRNEFFVCINDDELNPHKKPILEYWIENENKHRDIDWLKNITKEEFIDLTLQRVEIHGSFMSSYRFGDLGPIYGKQWRNFGYNGIDQINHIIKTLKENPNDRRMLCLAFNPDQLDEMALPPCHVMMQFYARELTTYQRLEAFKKRCKNDDCFEKYEKSINPWVSQKDKKEIVEKLDEFGIPKYGLSCMWTQRSVDTPLGLCWNIASYSILTYMIAKLVDMEADELIGSLGDCHIYMNQMEGVEEHLRRNGYEECPQLIINGNQKTIEDFKYDDFEIVGYKCDPPIIMPLSVG